MTKQPDDPVTAIRECLEGCGISAQEYRDVILGLFQAASTDPEDHRLKRYDNRGSPISHSSVSRNFEGVRVIAEDRGPVYAVWIVRTRPEATIEEVVGFAEFPWGQPHV